MTMEVRPCLALSRASWTTFSLSVSRAEVASSRRRILGFRTRALAMAILCLYPPLSWVPLLPTVVAYPYIIIRISYIVVYNLKIIMISYILCTLIAYA